VITGLLISFEYIHGKTGYTARCSIMSGGIGVPVFLNTEHLVVSGWSGLAVLSLSLVLVLIVSQIHSGELARQTRLIGECIDRRRPRTNFLTASDETTTSYELHPRRRVIRLSHICNESVAPAFCELETHGLRPKVGHDADNNMGVAVFRAQYAQRVLLRLSNSNAV